MRLYANDVPDSDKNVSIHASVKDATSDGSISVFCDEVSIHASVKDATYAGHHHISDLVVSIHASVKDATFFDSSL